MEDEHRARLHALKSMVLGERRVFSEESIAADPARLAAGWERRFVADGRRAAEAAVLYESLGFEVAADPVKIESLDPDCADCQLVMLLDFKVIYTRRREGDT
ncbi:MAG TPA: hypothetical protein VND92_00190 [Vicinamibacterales bacterium]|nr:hypothetical protein [Vicinamibacterales bacterium]